jgi:hypothetical protein
LAVGDYALASDCEIPKRPGALRPVRFSVERKSLDDFLNSISTGWESGSIRKFMNFDAQWKPLIGEFNFQDVCFKQVGDGILAPEHNHPQLRPAFVARRIAELGAYNVSVLMAGDSQLAAGLVYRIFRRRVDHLAGLKC